MATETLLEGAVTFAAAGWSGSGIADSNDYIINKPFGPITAGLDQSGLATGIESMWFYPGAVGVVGGGANGPFIVDADNSADAFVNNYGAVTLYLQAGGGSGVINNFACGPNSINYLQGGSFPTIVQDGGTLVINASTDFDDLYVGQGSCTVEYHATDADSITIDGGTAVIKRLPTTLTVNAGRVVLDPDDAEGVSGKTINIKGGYVDWRAGAIPTVAINAGEVDFRRARVSFTPGGSAFTYTSGAIIHRNDAVVSLSNLTNVGSSKANAGSASPAP
ncbi:MAG: hypothetical protein JJ916_04145 [Phycisphaerales bacterium]|nr:hypothetical protein [Phycisphaerales bacterium]